MQPRNPTEHSLTLCCLPACLPADYMTKVIVKGRNSSSTKVTEIMTPADRLIMVTPKHSVLDVMSLMVEKNLRHIPVVRAAVGPGSPGFKLFTS